MAAQRFTLRTVVSPFFASRSLSALGLGLSLLALTLLVLYGTGHAAPSAQSPTPAPVVINEVAWGGTAANSTHEWIELYNNTASDIDLTGWRLYSSDGKPNITLTGVISAFGYYLIERSTDGVITDILADLVVSFGSSSGAGLSNSGEALTLTNPSGEVIDTANGDGGAWPAGSGSSGYLSMERIDPAAPDSDTNWASNNGIIRNGLDANNNPISGTPKCRNSVASPAVDLVVFKSAPTEAWAGQVMTYVLHLRNAGNISATAVFLTDTLPGDTSLLSQDSSYTFTEPTPGTLVWEIGTLPISTTFSSVTVTVQTAEGFSGTLVNSVTATTAVTEATAGNNVAQATTLIHQTLPDLRLTKTGPSIAAVGETVTYVLTLTNSGLLTATASRLTDTLPPGLDSIQGTPAPSVFAPPSLIWDLGEVSPGTSLWFTVTGRVAPTAPMTGVNYAIATSAENDASPEDNTAGWTTSLIPYLRLYALAPVNYYGSGEAAA
ncbi:MAG: lamin tail domain-containing protein, partial [Anaerolineae bacterium]